MSKQKNISKAEAVAERTAIREMNAYTPGPKAVDCLNTACDMFLKLADLTLDSPTENLYKYERALSFYNASLDVADLIGYSSVHSKYPDLLDRIMFGALRESLAEIEDIVHNKEYFQYKQALDDMRYLKITCAALGIKEPVAFERLEKELSEGYLLSRGWASIGCDGYP